MNADIGYNGRVENQKSVLKAQLVEETAKACEALGVDVPEVLTSEVEAQLSEDNLWLAVQVEKFKRINAAVGAKEAAA
jgi:hypothetical protein